MTTSTMVVADMTDGPLRGHRYEVHADEVGRPPSRLEISGPRGVVYGYRRGRPSHHAGRWTYQQDDPMQMGHPSAQSSQWCVRREEWA